MKKSNSAKFWTNNCDHVEVFGGSETLGLTQHRLHWTYKWSAPVKLGLTILKHWTHNFPLNASITYNPDFPLTLDLMHIVDSTPGDNIVQSPRLKISEDLIKM